MNAVARTHNVYVQPLPNEVVLYDGTSHQAHCVNETVFKIWQNADGTRSVDQLAEIMTRDLKMSCSREIVLLALEDLRQANLLEDADLPSEAYLPSRRDVARKLSLAGLSLSLLPFVSSMVAPTPAMARSGSYSAKGYQQEYSEAMADVKPYITALDNNKNNSLTDLNAATTDGADGIIAAVEGHQTAAQTDFANAQTEFNDMLNALGLPSL